MVAFFMPRNKVISKTINLCNPTSRRWTVRWSSRKTSSNKATINTNTSEIDLNSGPILQSSLASNASSSLSSSALQHQKDKGQQQHKKGKFSSLYYFHTNWSWKAGASGWTILSILDWWLLATGSWFTWSSLFMRWTPIGVCVYAAIEWHLHNQQLEKKGLPRTASQFQANVYCSLPLRLVSRLWGWLADCTVPENLRPYVYGLYCYTFKVNLDEAANPELKDYKSLSEFFTRSLRDDVRCIHPFCSLVSPADGTVLHYGLATNAQIEQVKGITYRIDSFLGPDDWIQNKKSTSYIENIKYASEDNTNLYQCVIYLAPGDYHRFHSPAKWEPQLRRHFVGELLSVSPKIAQWLPELFCLNERVLYIGKWDYGFFSFTAVGATNVGSVQIYFDSDLKTNKWFGFKPITHKYKHYYEFKLPPKVTLNKGELLGQFNMGSTIVLLFEAPKEFKFTISAGQRIKMGESLGYIGDEKETNDKNSKKILQQHSI